MKVARAIAVVAMLAPACTCNESSSTAPATESPVGDRGARHAASAPAVAAVEHPGGLSAPMAAARVEGGAIVVAGLDVPAKAIRLQKIDAKDAVVAERTVLDGAAWSTESDLRLAPAGAGVALTWRGKRDGKLVRQVLVLGADLAPTGGAADVKAAACATADAFWSTDGKHAEGRPWSSPPVRISLPKDKDVSLVCGARMAFALLEDDDGSVSAMALGEGKDGGARAVAVLQESAFGEDEQRERAEYTVGDELGVVRLARSGTLTLRELRAGALGPLSTLKTKLPADADVVAVDASARAVIVVYTDDVSASCDGSSGTRVAALRVDRTTLEENDLELSPGACGREVGPFFTGAVGEGVMVAWVERVPVRGQSRAPIEGLSYRLVPAAGPPPPLGRVEQAADALVDAGCDATRCYAAALARRPGTDAMVSGVAKALRYP